MKTFETLLLDEPAAHVLRVTLNRPEVSNAMNTQMGMDKARRCGSSRFRER